MSERRPIDQQVCGESAEAAAADASGDQCHEGERFQEASRCDLAVFLFPDRLSLCLSLTDGGERAESPLENVFLSIKSKYDQLEQTYKHKIQVGQVAYRSRGWC